jgi:hypothetical protein
MEKMKMILFVILSERRNTRNTRDRLLEEQNAAYLDSVRADEEKVCYFEKKRLIKISSF